MAKFRRNRINDAVKEELAQIIRDTKDPRIADAFVSIFALQRSMLVSFEGMNETEIIIMNAVLGSAVCIIVFLLGLNLVRSKKILFKNIEQ